MLICNLCFSDQQAFGKTRDAEPDAASTAAAVAAAVDAIAESPEQKSDDEDGSEEDEEKPWERGGVFSGGRDGDGEDLDGDGTVNTTERAEVSCSQSVS